MSLKGQLASDSSRTICFNKPYVGRRNTFTAGDQRKFSGRYEVYIDVPLSKPFNPLRCIGSCRAGRGSPTQRRSRLLKATVAGEASDTPVNKQAERSQLINQELILFIFQLDLDSQLQRALNYENYDVAQQVRARRQAVDEAVAQLQERKGAPIRRSKATMSDIATQGLQVRSELQKAIEEERYEEAAQLRDRLRAFQAQSGAAEALAAEWSESGGPRWQLGQRVRHKAAGYSGVIAGWDEVCCEDAEWQRLAGVQRLARGATQPFYHVLVDIRDWPDSDEAPVAYVAEDCLDAPQPPSSWVAQYGDDELQHPYSYLLFLGTGGTGDLIPCRQLRDKFMAPRRDLPRPGDDGNDAPQGGD